MIAFMGVSGAGKSYLLKNLPSRYSFHVVTASELIKRQIKSRESLSVSSEQMRLSATNDMQALLIEAVIIERQTAKFPIILDCYAVIDKGDYLDPVPTDVFEKIGVLRVIHLVFAPARYGLGVEVTTLVHALKSTLSGLRNTKIVALHMRGQLA